MKRFRPTRLHSAALGICLCLAAVRTGAQLYEPPAVRQPEAAIPSTREPYLSELDQILSASANPLEICIRFADAEILNDYQIAQGAAIAQALALRAGYRPIHAAPEAELVPGRFNVVVGTVDQLRSEIPSADLKKIQRGYIAIRRMRTPGGYVLYVVGREARGIDAAVLSLGLVREKFPRKPSAAIREIILPTAPPFYRRSPLESNRLYTFDQLQKGGAGISMPPGGGMAMDLFYPGYLRTEAKSEAKLDLHFALKTGAFGSGSALTVTLNGVPLTPTSGGSAKGYSGAAFTFPVSLFQPGRNTLVITSDHGAELRIFSDSELVLPTIESGVDLPDLRVTSRTFFPFIGQPDGSDLAVVLTSRDREELSSAWTLLARLAQSANTFFYNAQITLGTPDPHRHQLVVGPYDRLPDNYRKFVSLSAFDEAHLDTPVAEINGSASGVNLADVLKAFVQRHARKESAGNGNAAVGAPLPAAPVKESFGLLACHQPVEGRAGWILIVSALGNEKTLQTRIRTLVEPNFWLRIRGDIVRWETSPDSFDAHVPGQIRKEMFAAKWSADLPLGETMPVRNWVALVAGMLILCVILTAKVLRKYEELLKLRQRRP